MHKNRQIEQQELCISSRRSKESLNFYVEYPINATTANNQSLASKWSSQSSDKVHPIFSSVPFSFIIESLSIAEFMKSKKVVECGTSHTA